MIFPPTLSIAAIAAAVSAVAGFGLAWRLQSGNIAELENDYANTRMAEQRAAHAVKERQLDAVIKAQNNGAARVAVLRRELDSARGAATGLRDEIDIAMRASRTSIDACLVTATTTSELLAVCANRYSELAGKAQGHVSDIRTLIDSWPK